MVPLLFIFLLPVRSIHIEMGYVCAQVGGQVTPEAREQWREIEQLANKLVLSVYNMHKDTTNCILPLRLSCWPLQSRWLLALVLFFFMNINIYYLYKWTYSRDQNKCNESSQIMRSNLTEGSSMLCHINCSTGMKWCCMGILAGKWLYDREIMRSLEMATVNMLQINIFSIYFNAKYSKSSNDCQIARGQSMSVRYSCF